MAYKFILVRQDKQVHEQYFYGPFDSASKAWEWAENNLVCLDEKYMTLTVKRIYL